MCIYIFQNQVCANEHPCSLIDQAPNKMLLSSLKHQFQPANFIEVGDIVVSYNFFDEDNKKWSHVIF